MHARRARWTDLDDPVGWDKKIPKETRPNFFDSNTWTVTYDRPQLKQLKTECTGTDGRAMGSWSLRKKSRSWRSRESWNSLARNLFCVPDKWKLMPVMLCALSIFWM